MLAGSNSFVADPIRVFAAAEAKSTKACHRSRTMHRHACLGLANMFTKRATEGIAECEHALELDRNLALAHAYIGFGKIFLVAPKKQRLTLPRPCASVRAIRRQLFWMVAAGQRRTTSAYNQAVALVSTGDRGQPNFSDYNFSLVAALAQVGRLDEPIPP